MQMDSGVGRKSQVVADQLPSQPDQLFQAAASPHVQLALLCVPQALPEALQKEQSYWGTLDR